MLEQEKWKDRIEVSLDNRQIFLLFAASAVLLSLVFALGVVVGKRLSPAAITTPKTDPLALLDEMGQPTAEKTQPALSFPKTLSKAQPLPSVATPDKAPAKADSPAQNETLASQTKKSDPAKAPKPAAPPVEVKTPKAPKPALAKAEKLPKPAPKLAARDSKQKEAKASKTPKGDEDDNDGAGFTLQLSSFQDKHEAEQYVESLRSRGHDPHVLPSKIPGRGLWYRVRVGHFTSWKRALEAKLRFERDHQIIAYVARR